MGRQKSNFGGSSRPPKPPPICTFCGIRPGKERGHVIPKCFFDVLPLINLTVPACAECERGRGDGGPREIHLDEEYMANVLCMDVASERHVEVRQLLEKRVFRSFANSPRMRNSILRTIRPVELRNEQGIILPEMHVSFEIDLPRVERVIRKITKGLYYAANQHTGIPSNYAVEAIPRVHPSMFAWLRKTFADASHVGPFGFGENEVFTYMGARQPHDHSEQYFLMVFYRHFVSIGHTKRREGTGALPPVAHDVG